MAIDIDGYNTMFRNFAEFAQKCVDAGASKEIVTVKEGQPLDGRRVLSISNTHMDALYRMRRGGELKDVNDFTRALFKDAIADLFGGELKIPENVKKAMLLSDFGCGKPLTARRIMAVKVEVDKATAKMREAVAAVNATVDSVFDAHSVQIVEDPAQANGAERLTREQLHALAAVAVTRAAHDPDALDVVVKTIRYLIRGGDSRFRTAEAVRAKVDAIMANMVELRAAVKGDKALLAAGKTMLVDLDGNAIGRGLFTQMVKAVGKMKTDAIRKLSPSSTALQFHTAVAQLRDNIQNGIVKSGLEKALVGGDEVEAARGFFTQAVLSKCGRSTLDTMRSAFGTDTASKLVRLYDLVYRREVGMPPDVSRGLAEYAADQGAVSKKTMARLNSTLGLLCGALQDEPDLVEEFQGELDYEELEAFDIVQDMLKAGREAKDVAHKSFLNGVVAGNGQGAAVMREIYSRKMGPDAYNPGDKIRTNLTAGTATMLGWNIMTHCKNMAVGKVKDTVFFKDVVRDLNVNLPDGKKLSNDFNTACDELTSFLTKGEKTSYAALDEKEKAKVHILMSLLTQETMKAAFDAAAITLHPDMSTEAFMTAGKGMHNQGAMEFSLSVNDQGDIKMTCSCSKEVAMITSFDGTGKVKNTQTGPGSKMEAEIVLVLQPTEMERLAGLDYSKFDDEEAKRQFAGTSNNKLAAIYTGFGPDFRLNYDNIMCSSHVKSTIN